MAILWYGLAVLILLDSLRMRKRWKSVPTLAPSATPVPDDVCFLTAPDVDLTDDVRRAAASRLEAEGLDLLDLAPADLPALRALGAAQMIDRRALRDDRHARGHTVGYALAVRKGVLERAQVQEGPQANVAVLARSATRLKRFADRGADVAVAPGLSATERDPYACWPAVEAAGGNAVGALLLLSVAFVLVMLTGLVVAPLAGAAAVAAFHLQAWLVLTGAPIAPRGMAAALLLRTPLSIWHALRLLLAREKLRRAEADAWRPTYRELLADGLEPFFLPRRSECPICGSKRLRRRLRTTDLLQTKPGVFTLDRCLDCGHIFQNPQLSPRGLSFYYRDFYDGLGQGEVERAFENTVKYHAGQIEAVRQVVEPQSWLDVGAGYGHFCHVARQSLPNTRFDGLDLSEGIDEAARAGWISAGYRGFFPDLAPDLENRYDVVSMFHYLEHTPDVRRELRAALTTLKPGGFLVIEVPDPECPTARFLGRFWLPWLQPQHLNLMSMSVLERVLRETGFEPALSQRAEADRRHDFACAAGLLANFIAPSAQLPWRPRPSLLRRLWSLMVRPLTAPLVLAGALADRLSRPLMRRRNSSNGYRVVARSLKPAPPLEAAAAPEQAQALAMPPAATADPAFLAPSSSTSSAVR